MSARIVIAGGGLAAQRCAEALRRGGHDGEVMMLGAEHHRPYDRPPLSKQALHEGPDLDALAFRPAAWYEANGVELRLGAPASSLDSAARRVGLADGTAVEYGQLVIATGSRPRTLEDFAGRENVITLRDVADARRLRAALVPGARLLIIGAGFIGQEVASAAAKLGARATIVELEPAPLARIVGTELGTWFAELHRARGVEVLTGDCVDVVHGERHVEAVTLASGRRIALDYVLVGVGAVANVEWLEGSGIDVAPVRVDDDGRSALPGVWAAGDAASVYDPLLQAHVPGTQWESAARQGARVAKSILGQDTPALPPASFWSDIHGIRIHQLGRVGSDFDLRIEGDSDAADFTAIFERDGDVVAVLLVGRPQELPAARSLLAKSTERIPG